MDEWVNGRMGEWQPMHCTGQPPTLVDTHPAKGRCFSAAEGWAKVGTRWGK